MAREAVDIVGEPRIPVFLAVGFWLASGLAVLTYTAVAFKETSTGVEEALVFGVNPLAAEAAVFAANEVGGTKKPLNRNKFNPSPQAAKGNK